MHKRLSWLTVGANLNSSLLLFMKALVWNGTPHLFSDKLAYTVFLSWVYDVLREYWPTGSTKSTNILHDGNCCLFVLR